MKCLAVAVSLMLASTAAAVPGLTGVGRSALSNSTCLQQSDAESIVNKFIIVIEHLNVTAANATAQELLVDSFSETSDSINMIAGNPLGTVSFPNKVAYVNSVLNAPAPHNVTTIKVMPAGCTNILWYWKMIVGTNKAPVQGFNLMETDGNMRLAGQFVEFNSIAWSIDTGFTVINRAGQKLPITENQTSQTSAATSMSSSSRLLLLLTGSLGLWMASL